MDIVLGFLSCKGSPGFVRQGKTNVAYGLQAKIWGFFKFVAFFHRSVLIKAKFHSFENKIVINK